MRVLGRLNPRSMLRLPARTVRMRLTALYACLFLLTGASLLAVTHVLIADTAHPLQVLPQQLLINLAVVAVFSVALGWFVAGRVLRPLRTITATTKRISEDNLHQRLALPGPRDELKELADTIDELLARLEAAFNGQRNFVGNASHELRTPLALTRALLQMRLRDPNTTADEFRLTSEEVLAAGEQQERLIESLLILARSQHGLDHHEPFDLATVASDVADAQQAAAAARGLRVDISVSPAPTHGDPYLAERLVSNLVENAINYNAPHGHVEILVQENDQAVLQVTNTGPVVPADAIGRLLQPFQRDTLDRTGTHDGLGLGLAIVAAIAKAHGAGLDVRPEEAGGLAVKVAFPSARSSRNALAGASRPPTGPESQIVRPDDHQANARHQRARRED